MSSAAQRHAARAADRAAQLPPGFVSMADIIDEKVRVGNFASVAGLVKNCRAPIATRGGDYKMALILFDISIQDAPYGLDLNIFGPAAEMPQVSAGDVILVVQAKVQKFRSDPLSLITAYRTVVHVFSASKILSPPKSAKGALLPPHKKKGPTKPPSDEECEFVSHLYHAADKSDLPTQEAFQAMTVQSLNVRQKFSLLQDIREGKFYDLVVQVAREPYDGGDKVTLYVSDYTENEHFFNYTWEGCKDLTYGDADGHRLSQSSTQKEWVGPYGKRVIQLTCYEPHATSIRSETKAGSWVLLQNVQMKFGRNGQNLEGYMRGDQKDARDKICVHPMGIDMDNRDAIDPRLKDAIRRARDYNKAKKADLKRLEETETNLKRKRNEPEKKKLNSKQRRKLKRAETEKKAEEKDAESKNSLGLNQRITSESIEIPVRSVESIIEPVIQEMVVDGAPAKLHMPFVNNKYRANVRVVDFRPNHLEDFSCSRRITDFDCLSDNSADESSDSGDDDDDVGSGKLAWEWRFMLQLEDASAKDKTRSRAWVVVDNSEAQCLTGLDAVDLRRDHETLGALREKLFTLWGDLEEHKIRKAAEQEAIKKRRPGDMPPLDSSDAEDGRPRPGAKGKGKGNEAAVSNKPFTCCLKQYGVSVREDNPAKANAGDGRRWERVFGLFGTKICA